MSPVLRRGLGTWTGRLIAAALTGIVGSAVAYVFSNDFWHSAARHLGTAAPALRVQVIDDVDRFHSDAVHVPAFVIPGARPLPAPPSGERPDGRWAWAHEHGGIDADETLVRLVLTGRSAEPVIVQDAHVRVLARRTPVRRGSYLTYMGLGAGQSVRHFAVALDREPPLMRHIGSRGTPDAYFPLRVTNAEVEIFDILASTSICDCSWVVEIDYTAAGEDGKLRVDDHGRPFRTTAGGLFASVTDHDSLNGYWAPAQAWGEGRWTSLPSADAVCGPRLVAGVRIAMLARTPASCRSALTAAAAHLRGSSSAAGGWTCEDAAGTPAASEGGVAVCHDAGGASAVAVNGDRQARAFAQEH
jgi:hypothetical protein